MAIQFPTDFGPISSQEMLRKVAEANTQPKTDNFMDSIGKSFAKMNTQQQQSDTSITELLSGKQQDINAVVASVAKADMSFKVLVGVRNKLVEAYKETMKMQG
jgi:flagellar hook-basal body complex protein FliE